MPTRLKNFPWLVVSAAVVAAGALLWTLYFIQQYDLAEGLNHYEAITTIDLAQVARRVADGRGFVTGFIRPISLRFHDELPNHPELTHPPFYILILAGVIKLGRASDLVLVLTSAFFFWICVPLLWYLGRKFLDYRALALALVLYFINPFLLAASINGGPATLAAFLMLLFFLCLWRAKEGGATWALAGGVVTGLAALTRYSFILWLLPGGLFIYAGRAAGWRKRLGLFIAGAFAAGVPWLTRNLVVTGNPLFTLRSYAPVMDTPFRPGLSLWRGFSAQSLLIPRRYAWAVRKFILGFRDQYLGILLITGNYSGVFVIAAVLHKFRDRVFQQLKHVFYATIILEILYFGLYQPDWYALPAFIPWGLLIGSSFFLQLMDQFSSSRLIIRATAVVFLLLLSIIPVSDKFGSRFVKKFPAHNREFIETVARKIAPENVIVSDVPWAVAWYGDRSAVWLPKTLGDYEEIRIYHNLPVVAFYLTDFYLSVYFPEEERHPDWLRIYQTVWTPQDWNLPHITKLPNGHILISRDAYP